MGSNAGEASGASGGAQDGGDAQARFLTRIVEPARLSSSPFRDRLENGARRKGYRMDWMREDGHGLSGLRMVAYDGDVIVQDVAVSKLEDRFDEAAVAEGICEWILEPPVARAAIGGITRG